MGRKRIRFVAALLFSLVYVYIFYSFSGVLIYRTMDSMFTILLTISVAFSYAFLDCDFRENNPIKNNYFLSLGIVLCSFISFWSYGISRIGIIYNTLTMITISAFMLIWCLVMIIAIFGILSYIKIRYMPSYKHIISSRMVCFIIFFIMLFGVLRISVYFAPGIISPDNMVIYHAATHIDAIKNRSDIHSFAMILLVKLFTLFTDNYFIITVAFGVLFSIVWSYMMYVLYLYGFPFVFEVAISVLYILMPSNAFLFAATWKDIPFAISMLLLSTVLIKAAYNNYQIKKDVLLLGLGLIGTALFRNNGQVSFIACSVVLVVISIKKHYKRLLFGVLLSVGIVLFFKGPVFWFLNVDRGSEGFASIPFIDGVWENIYEGNEIDQETLDYLQGIMPIENYENCYVDYYTNTTVFPPNYEGVYLSDSVKAYFRCLMKYPFTTLKARIKKTYNLWSVYPNLKYPVNYNLVRDINIYTIGYGYNWQYSAKFQEERNQLMDLLANTDNGLFHFLNRGSLGFIITLWLTFYNIILKRYSIIIASFPALFSHIALLAACCFNDYRYSWPVFLLTIPYFCSFFIDKKQFVKSWR